MKINVFKKISMLLMATASLAGLSGCQAEMETPEITAPVATMQANTTIAELKTAFDGVSVLCPMKDEATNTPYIIKGRVISSDATGNIYKSLVIQDETGAMPLSINQNSMYTDYPVGQEVVLNVTGLYIGYYRGLQQIGWLGTPYDGVTQLNFMAWDMFRAHSEVNGFPNNDFEYVSQDGVWPSDKPYCVVTTIGALPASGADFRAMQGQLVEFRNVYFEEGGKTTYARYQETMNANIKDASGATIIVRTSGYSTFYNQTLPEGTGTVRGILSYYGSEWQLLLRSLEDVMFDQKGQEDDPYTIEEAIEAQNTGVTAWTKGYIVGSVKAGVQQVTSNDQIMWAEDVEIDNNVVIAPSKDTKDYTQCMIVELPQGTPLREYVNLIDNPENYGQEFAVMGELTTFLGLPGVVGGGAANTFSVNGVHLGGNGGGTTPTPEPEGDGTKEKPFTIAQVMASTADATGVWVEGYVAGYVADINWQSSAVFGSQATEGSTNYTNGTNVILSSVAAAQASTSNSIPVGLSTQGDVRSQLGLSKNPGVYGKKVKVKGDITKYFGVRGMKNVTEYDFDGAGTTPTPTPDPTPTPGAGDGTLDNPFTVDQVMASTADANGVWMIGYVAGYVADINWQSSAVFGSQATEGSTNYANGTNVIISSGPAASATLNNSIPVGLDYQGDIRSNLGLSKNPGIYGKKVKIKGNITKYFGIRGMKNATEYVIVD